MRILDQDHDIALNEVLIMLTLDEVHQLAGFIRGLDERGRAERKSADHIHVSDENYQKEVTIGIYFPKDLRQVSPRVIRLIENDE